MKVLNVHTRELNSPKSEVLDLFATLSKKEDSIWPLENWPRMRFDKGLHIGSEGGHGPIRYKVVDYDPNGVVEFEFQQPHGFDGTHKFEIADLKESKTLVKHTIAMETNGMGTLKWLIAIRSLHDALIEDAFDKIENQINGTDKKLEWSVWVKILRGILT